MADQRPSTVHPTFDSSPAGSSSQLGFTLLTAPGTSTDFASCSSGIMLAALPRACNTAV